LIVFSFDTNIENTVFIQSLVISELSFAFKFLFSEFDLLRNRIRKVCQTSFFELKALKPSDRV
jgi:hypothetical protein